MKNFLKISRILFVGFLVFLANSVFAQLSMPGAGSSSVGLGGNAPAANSNIKEGVDYRVLPTAQPVETKGKVEVIEFFWYGCPHCFDFDPELQAWVKKQNRDVVFKRVPIAFREDFLAHSQIFYALESLGKEPAFTPKIFNAINVGHKQLTKEAEISDWMASQGLDPKAFMAAYKSFSVVTKAKSANKIGEAFRIDGVPTIAIGGKYITSPSIAGTKARALETMDFLVTKARKELR